MVLRQNSLRRAIVVLVMQEHQSNTLCCLVFSYVALNNSNGLSIPQVVGNEMKKVVLLDFVDVGW